MVLAIPRLAAQEAPQSDAEAQLKKDLETRRAEMQREFARALEEKQAALRQQLERQAEQLERAREQLERARRGVRSEREAVPRDPRPVERPPGGEASRRELPMLPGRFPGRPVEREVRRGEPGPEELDRMRRQDPEGFKLLQGDMDMERQSRELAEKYRAAEGPKKEDLRGQLKVLASKHFEVRQGRREHEVKRLEEQLDRLRSSVKDRAARRDDLIRRRLQELMGEPQDEGF
jgi:hypothetical protein